MFRRKEKMMIFNVSLHSLLRRRAVVVAHKLPLLRLSHLSKAMEPLLRYLPA